MSLKKPPLSLQTTTLWEYPSQHYGTQMQGDQRYVGATPSYVIWNLLKRYTQPGELVVDPMCGSGTTLDVARDLQREARGFDVQPFRNDIERADARKLPLKDNTVDFFFMDPPYGDHIKYSEDPQCIGRLSAYDESYFEAMDLVLRQARRVLKPGRHVAVYVCDYFEKKSGFVPTGARLLYMMAEHFEIVDHIAVVRHNKSLEKANWHQAAARDNFYLRGFNHLIIAQKPQTKTARR